MKITLVLIGKTSETYLETGISIFENRLRHYIPFKIQTIPSLKNASAFDTDKLKEKEGELILKNVSASDYVVLLDEKGKHLSSVEFSSFIEKSMLDSVGNLIFIVGGAFGVSQAVKDRCNLMLALSKMTFSHQMVRLIFIEQVYRAMTIIKNESYHHP